MVADEGVAEVGREGAGPGQDEDQDGEADLEGGGDVLPGPAVDAVRDEAPDVDVVDEAQSPDAPEVQNASAR